MMHITQSISSNEAAKIHLLCPEIKSRVDEVLRGPQLPGGLLAGDLSLVHLTRATDHHVFRGGEQNHLPYGCEGGVE